MTIWFTSDTHFGHANLLTFTATDANGLTYKLRPEFTSVEEMDETMIERWNAKVKPSDHIYHLGDVTMDKRVIDRVMPRLQGHKRLLVGNHDIFPTRLYSKYFEKIAATRLIDNVLFSHIPLHPHSVPKWCRGNVHGHLHNNPGSLLGAPYLNVCVEHTGYAPLSLEEIKERIANQAALAPMELGC